VKCTYLLVFAAISLSSQAQAITLTCTYSNSGYSGYAGTKYYCVASGFYVTTRNQVVTGVTGSHTVSGYTNAQVTAMYIASQACYYLPSGLGNFFPNLLSLEFNSAQLKEITKNDLRQFPKLQYFVIMSNQIEQLEKDLFMYNPEITTIRIQNNAQLKRIHPEITLPLKKLSSTTFSGNHASCSTITTCYDLLQLFRDKEDLESHITALLNGIYASAKRGKYAEKQFKSQCANSQNEYKKNLPKIHLTCDSVEFMFNKCLARNFTSLEMDAFIVSVGEPTGREADTKSVTELVIYDQDVAFLPTNIGKTFPKLQTLSVTKSNLLIINQTAFAEMKGLKFVNMSGNRIKEIYDINFLRNYQH